MYEVNTVEYVLIMTSVVRKVEMLISVSSVVTVFSIVVGTVFSLISVVGTYWWKR